MITLELTAEQVRELRLIVEHDHQVVPAKATKIRRELRQKIWEADRRASQEAAKQVDGG